MEKIQIDGYTISLYGKADKSAHNFHHNVHKEFLSVTQVHGNKIYQVSGDESYGQLRYDADGIMSNNKHAKGIGVYVSDCSGIVFLGKNNYSIIHAGWRGLQKNIIIQAIQKLKITGEKIENCKVYTGPNLKVDNFEVGSEFTNYFDKQFLPIYGNRIHLDMNRYIVSTLIGYGISSENIILHEDCTFKKNSKRFSYRKGDKGLRNFIGVSFNN